MRVLFYGFAVNGFNSCGNKWLIEANMLKGEHRYGFLILTRRCSSPKGSWRSHLSGVRLTGCVSHFLQTSTTAGANLKYANCLSVVVLTSMELGSWVELGRPRGPY